MPLASHAPEKTPPRSGRTETRVSAENKAQARTSYAKLRNSVDKRLQVGNKSPAKCGGSVGSTAKGDAARCMQKTAASDARACDGREKSVGERVSADAANESPTTAVQSTKVFEKFLHRNIDVHNEHVKNRRKVLVEAQEKKINAICPFRPAVSDRAVRRQSRGEGIYEVLYKQGVEKQENMAAFQAEKRHEMLKREMKDCTFTPQTNWRSWFSGQVKQEYDGSARCDNEHRASLPARDRSRSEHETRRSSMGSARAWTGATPSKTRSSETAADAAMQSQGPASVTYGALEAARKATRMPNSRSSSKTAPTPVDTDGNDTIREDEEARTQYSASGSGACSTYAEKNAAKSVDADARQHAFGRHMEERIARRAERVQGSKTPRKPAAQKTAQHRLRLAHARGFESGGSAGNSAVTSVVSSVAPSTLNSPEASGDERDEADDEAAKREASGLSEKDWAELTEHLRSRFQGSMAPADFDKLRSHFSKQYRELVETSHQSEGPHIGTYRGTISPPCERAIAHTTIDLGSPRQPDAITKYASMKLCDGDNDSTDSRGKDCINASEAASPALGRACVSADIEHSLEEEQWEKVEDITLQEFDGSDVCNQSALLEPGKSHAGNFRHAASSEWTRAVRNGSASSSDNKSERSTERFIAAQDANCDSNGQVLAGWQSPPSRVTVNVTEGVKQPSTERQLPWNADRGQTAQLRTNNACSSVAPSFAWGSPHDATKEHDIGGGTESFGWSTLALGSNVRIGGPSPVSLSPRVSPRLSPRVVVGSALPLPSGTNFAWQSQPQNQAYFIAQEGSSTQLHRSGASSCAPADSVRGWNERTCGALGSHTVAYPEQPLSARGVNDNNPSQAEEPRPTLWVPSLAKTTPWRDTEEPQVQQTVAHTQRLPSASFSAGEAWAVQVLDPRSSPSSDGCQSSAAGSRRLATSALSSPRQYYSDRTPPLGVGFVGVAALARQLAQDCVNNTKDTGSAWTSGQHASTLRCTPVKVTPLLVPSGPGSAVANDMENASILPTTLLERRASFGQGLMKSW